MKKHRLSYLLLIAPIFISIALLGSYFIKSEPTVVSNSKANTTPGRIVMSTWTIADTAQAADSTITSEPVPEPTPAPELAAAPTPAPVQKPKTPAPAQNRVKASTAEAVKAPAPQPAPQPAAPASCGGSYTEEFICLLNQYRASKGKGKVSYNAGLAKVAKTHSDWMLSTGTFSHTGVNGSRFFNRCEAAKVACRAENLAVRVGSAQNLLKMWRNSASHNANLLGPYSTIGLGFAGDYTTALFN